ncbi:uncharacterized protein LOC123537543 [Mercenaria mercenaria]|uniref:uncharacterized protein LOC123537543 n=1 Tax=Mercenaria mercenaria TaxID=6596 RepID=UPI00234F1CA8|nr:uncharacterized protein LOC123537543 [Mercenaria mercenaria]
MAQSAGLVLLVLACTLTYVSACTCDPMTTKQKFCNPDFASVFKIKDNGTVVGIDRVYKVEMLHQYRTTVPDSNPDAGKLYTPADSAACGVTFIRDTYYVVSGVYVKKPGQRIQMVTNKCLLQVNFPENPLETYVPPTCDPTTKQIKVDQETIF